MFQQLVRLYRRMKIERLRKPFKGLSVTEVFTETYRSSFWGPSDNGPFCSGHGSRGVVASTYAAFVSEFISDNNIRSVVDIGCGDFQVSKQINLGEAVYYGFDVVLDLIAYNERTYGNTQTHFRCVDAIEDELPRGDLCLIRQVLQHLSNEQIAKLLANVRDNFRYVLITEDIYVGPDVRPNIDAPTSPTTRWASNSGVYINMPPFNLPSYPVLEIPVAENAVLRTVLVGERS